MALGRIVKQARDMALTAQTATAYCGPAIEDLRENHPGVFRLYAMPGQVVRALSGGRIDLDKTDYVAVFRRAPDVPALREAA